MTVETDTSRVTYTGSGTTGPFAVNFYFLADEDIRAIKVLIADGTETELTLNDDFTLTGAGDADGGELTLSDTLSSSYRLVILRDPEALQESRIPRNDPFPSSVVEQGLDRLTMVVQRHADQIGRSLRLSDGDTSGADGIISNTTGNAGKFIRLATDGLSFEFVDGETTSDNFEQSGTGAVTTTVSSELSKKIHPAQFGGVGDGATDDRAAIQAAIDHATTLAPTYGGNVVVDLCGATWAIEGSTLNGKKGVFLKDGRLLATGTWTATDPLFAIGSVEGGGLIGVTIDCDHKCAGITRTSSKRTRLERIHVEHFETHGVKDTGNGGGNVIDVATIRQYVNGETGWDVLANRDAVGLYVDDADAQYTGVVSYYSGTPLKVTAAFNQFTDCHFFNGGTSSGTNNLAADIQQEPNLFNGCYFDNGVVKVTTEFSQVFDGCLFQKNADGNNTKAIDLVATGSNSTGAGLMVVACAFSGTFADGHLTFSTSGAGTWSNNTKIAWIGNATTAGNVAGGIVAQWLSHGRIDDSGRLIIGTYQAHAAGTGTTKQIQGHGTAGEAGATFIRWSADATGAVVNVGKSRGASIGTNTAPNSGDTLGTWRFVGSDGTDLNNSGAEMRADTTEAWSGSAQGTKLVWGTVTIGATSLTDRMSLDETGLNARYGLRRGLVTVTDASYTVLATDTNIIANRAGTVTLTLGTATLGKELYVRTIQAQTVVSAASNVVPLAGGAAGTAILAGTAGKWAKLVGDGTNWQIQAAA